MPVGDTVGFPLVVVDKQGGFVSGVVGAEMMDSSEEDKLRTGLSVPAARQPNEFTFDTVFLFGEVEADVGDQMEHVQWNLVGTIADGTNLKKHIP